MNGDVEDGQARIDGCATGYAGDQVGEPTLRRKDAKRQ
jgi:hypothetical protein